MRKNRKKLRLLALLLAALTLCGCSAAAAVRRPAQPQLQLYYCRKDSGDTKTGVLGTQEVPAQTDPAALLETYLQGPEDEALALPFTPGDTCAVESLQDGVLTLRLELRAAGDIRTSLIYACLTCTMTQLESVQSVAFLRTAQPQPQTDGPYTADDFVLLRRLGREPGIRRPALTIPTKTAFSPPLPPCSPVPTRTSCRCSPCRRSSARPCRSISAASSRRARR